MLESTSSSPQEKKKIFRWRCGGLLFGGCVAKFDFKNQEIMLLKLHKSSGPPMFWRHTHVIFALKGWWPSLPSENNGSLDPSTFNQQRRLFVEKLLLFFVAHAEWSGPLMHLRFSGDPIWHFGNVRRGNRISGSHSRQQEITTSRREMTWNDSKPLGPSGQTSKSCLLQSFEFIVEEHQNTKNVIISLRLKMCSTI